MNTTVNRIETAPARHGIPDFLNRVSTRVGHYFSRSRVQRQLEALDDRLLADIGLKRSDIQRMVWDR